MYKNTTKSYLSFLKRVLQCQIQDDKIPDDQIGEGKKYEWKTNSKNHQPILVNNTTGKVEAGIPKFSKSQHKKEFLAKMHEQISALKKANVGGNEIDNSIDAFLEFWVKTNDIKEDSLDNIDKRIVQLECLSQVAAEIQNKYPNSVNGYQGELQGLWGSHTALVLQNDLNSAKSKRTSIAKIAKWEGTIRKNHLSPEYVKKVHESISIKNAKSRNDEIAFALRNYKEFCDKPVALKFDEWNGNNGNSFGEAKYRWGLVNYFNFINCLCDINKKPHLFDMDGVQKFLPNRNYDSIGRNNTKRGKPMTHEEADNGRVNPNFNKDEGYQINCQTCVLTYLLRRLGYNVQAMPNYRTGLPHQLSAYTEDAVLNHDDNGEWSAVKRENLNPLHNKEEKVYDFTSAIKEKTKDDPDGAIYFFAYSYFIGTTVGHIICAEKNKGTIQFYDPQFDGNPKYNENLKWENFNDFLNKRQTSSIRIWRVDDKVINPDYIIGKNAIVKGAEE